MNKTWVGSGQSVRFKQRLVELLLITTKIVNLTFLLQSIYWVFDTWFFNFFSLRLFAFNVAIPKKNIPTCSASKSKTGKLKLVDTFTIHRILRLNLPLRYDCLGFVLKFTYKQYQNLLKNAQYQSLLLLHTSIKPINLKIQLMLSKIHSSFDMALLSESRRAQDERDFGHAQLLF